MTKIRVLINGAFGKMGQEAVQAVETDADLILVGKTGRNDNFASALQTSQAQVALDLTSVKSVFENSKTIIE